MERFSHVWRQPCCIHLISRLCERLNLGLLTLRRLCRSGLLLFFILLGWASLSHSEMLNNAQEVAPAKPTVLVMGDSLSAAFGIDKQKGWVALLAEEFADQIAVVNASISGETSSGGRYRIGKALQDYQPDLVIIELGGNDGLRGTAVDQIQANLGAMIQAAQAQHADVLLLGMRIPPNYGQRYTELFANMYHSLAAQYQTLFVPFFLEGAVGKEGMIQEDGIHPTELAQPIMAQWVFKELRAWLSIRSK